MVPNDSIQCMDQNDLIFVSNGHQFDKLQIIIVPDDRSHYWDEFLPKIVPIGQNFIRFRSVQSFVPWKLQNQSCEFQNRPRKVQNRLPETPKSALGGFWRGLGSSQRGLWVILGGLGRIWGSPGGSWDLLEGSWELLDSSWEHFGGHFGAFSVHFGALLEPLRRGTWE